MRLGIYIVYSAIFLVLVRLVCFDGPQYFGFVYIPNHDMYQAASFFATSMHSMRLYGDLAWWNPLTNGGYAQYYQHLFSPLAPTMGNVAFIVWAEFIWLISGFGVAIPEYVQYLVFNFILSPLLALTAFGWFVSFITRRRIAIFVAMMVFALSGIAVWNGSWMYLQESSTFFFLMGAALWAMRRPNWASLVVLMMALLVQLAAANYWTAYSLPMGLIFVLGYALTNWQLVRPNLAKWSGIARARPPLVALWLVPVCLTAVLWCGIIIAAQHEQSHAYLRTAGDFNGASAYARLHELRGAVTGLFDSSILRPLTYYKQEEGAHNARYLGFIVLPFLMIGLLRTWGRRERWLVLTAFSLFIVIIVPPWLVGLWQATPFLRPIRHFFYFYTQFWQIAVLLIALSGLDRWLRSAPGGSGKAWTWVGDAVGAGAFLLLCGYWVASARFPTNDNDLQTVLYFAMCMLIGGIIISRFQRSSAASTRKLFAAMLLVLAFADLSRYYREASMADSEFTATRADFSMPGSPLPSDIVKAFQTPWRPLDMTRAFDGGVVPSMPFKNDIWPENGFVQPYWLLLLNSPKDADFRRSQLVDAPPFSFFTGSVGTGLAAAEQAHGQFNVAFSKILEFDQSSVVATPPSRLSESTAPPTSWLKASYNFLAFKVQAPASGWLLVRQLADPHWEIKVDGSRTGIVQANVVGLAIKLTAGNHLITMTYAPLTRALFWPAAFLLQFSLAGGVVLLMWQGRRLLMEPSNTQFD